MPTKLGMMQPYFFPYPGYFALIKSVDIFVLFDTCHFRRHSWIDRNRILSLNSEYTYIRAQLTKTPSRGTPIKEIQLSTTEEWKTCLFNQLKVYKKTAPQYQEFHNIIEPVIFKPHTDLVELNKELLLTICAHLSIRTPIIRFSEITGSEKLNCTAGEWALACAKLLKCQSYTNPISGASLFSKQYFDDNNVRINFLDFTSQPYSRGGMPWVESLSIIDLMMFMDTGQACKYISDSYKITEYNSAMSQ
tara:strand:- start:2291 stop:3034 length:744 start_codon:yes stop_codon:yes gene_type:complete